MNFSQFKFCYMTFLLILKICVWITLIFWVKNSISYFETTDFFSYIREINKIESNLHSIWAILKEWLIDTGWVMARIVVFQIIGYCTKRFPVWGKWLAYWDNLGDISPVFGRLITDHLRRNNTINLKDIIYYHGYSKAELALLKQHSKNEYLNNFFKKHDPHFEKDLNQ